MSAARRHNCEHVVAEAAQLLAELLTAGGPLRVLATSRELLASGPVPSLPDTARYDYGGLATNAALAGRCRS